MTTTEPVELQKGVATPFESAPGPIPSRGSGMRSYAPREPFPGAAPWYVAVSHVLETDPYPVDYHLIFEGPRGMPSRQVLRCAEEELKHTAQPERLRENLLIMPHHQIMAGLYPRARDELLAREETEGIYLRQ